PQEAGLSMPMAHSASQVNIPSKVLVTSSISMYFWMDVLMSSNICTVIFLLDNEGPVSRTSFRLKVLPDSKAKNTMNKTMVIWPTNAAALTEPAHSQSFRL